MYCRKCGKPLEQGALFCMSCGTKVDAGYRNKAMKIDDYGEDGETATVDMRQRRKSFDEGQTDIMHAGMQPNTGRDRRPQMPHIQMGVPGAAVPGQEAGVQGKMQDSGSSDRVLRGSAPQVYGETERLSRDAMPESMRKFSDDQQETSVMRQEDAIAGRNPILRGGDPKPQKKEKNVVDKMNENVQKQMIPQKKPVNKKKLAIILSSIGAFLLIMGGLAYWLFVIRADKKFDQASVNQQMYSDIQQKSYRGIGYNKSSAVFFEEEEPGEGGGNLPKIKVTGKNAKTISLPGEITNVYYAGGFAIVDGCAYTRVVCDDKGGTQAVVIKADIKKGKSEILYRTGLEGNIDTSGCRFLSLFYAKPDGFYVFEQDGPNYKVQKVDWFGKKDGKAIATIGNGFVPGIKGDKLIAADISNSNVISVTLKKGKTENLFSLGSLPEEFGSLVTIYQSTTSRHYAFNDSGVLYLIEGNTEPSVTRLISTKELSYTASDGTNLHLYADPVLVNDEKNYYVPFFYENGEGTTQAGLLLLDAERGSLGGEALFPEKGVTGLGVKGDTLSICCSESGYQREGIGERISSETFVQARSKMESSLTDYCSCKITRNELDAAMAELKAADQAGFCYVREAADLLQEAVDKYNVQGYLSAYKKAKEALTEGETKGNIYTEECADLIIKNCLSNGLRYYEGLAEEALENGDLDDYASKIQALEALYADDPATLEAIAEFTGKHDLAAGTRAEDRESFRKFITDKILHKEGTQILDKEIAYFEADGVHVVHCLAFAIADFDGDGHEELFLYSWREAMDGSAPCGEAAIYDANGGNVTKTICGRSGSLNPLRLDWYGAGNLRVSGFGENGYADMYIGSSTEKMAELSCADGQVLCVNHDRAEDAYNVWRESESGKTEVQKMDADSYAAFEKNIRAGDIIDIEVLPFTESSLEKELGN